MSALLTTTMTYMKTVIDGFEAAGRGHIKMAVGGAPISQMFADEIGADGYGQNASAAVDSVLCGSPGKQCVVRKRSDHDLQDSLLAGNPLADQGGGRAGRSDGRARPRNSWSGSISWRPSAACRDADDYLAQWQWSEEQERRDRRRTSPTRSRPNSKPTADW